jgi:hypothetical protein
MGGGERFFENKIFKKKNYYTMRQGNLTFISCQQVIKRQVALPDIYKQQALPRYYKCCTCTEFEDITTVTVNTTLRVPLSQGTGCTQIQLGGYHRRPVSAEITVSNRTFYRLSHPGF